MEGGDWSGRELAHQYTVKLTERLYLLTVSRLWYPHIDRIVSHISQVEHGSPLAGAGAAPLRALIVLLAADTALAPLAFRIPFGASVVEFWCMLAGRVERDDIRL